MTSDQGDRLPVYGEPRHAWLDWLRGISILMVLGSHYQVNWWDAGLFEPLAMLNMRVGWAGVDCFFMISGFLIGNLLLGEVAKYDRLDVSRFYFRRLLKIWPLYYLTCLLFILSAPWLSHMTLVQAFRLISPALIHLQNYIAPMAMGHLWSLAVEEHFYLLLPVLLAVTHARAGPRRFPAMFLVVILAGWAAVFVLRFTVSIAEQLPSIAVRDLTHFRIDTLFAGVVMAWIYRYRPDVWPKMALNTRLLIVVGALGAFAFAFNPNKSVFVSAAGFTLLQLLFGSLLLFASRFETQAPRPALVPGLDILAWIGRHSYPIYLFHPFFWLAGGKPLQQAVASADFSGRSLLWLLGYVAFVGLSICVGAAVGNVLEKPLLRLRNRVMPPRTLAFEGDPLARQGQSA